MSAALDLVTSTLAAGDEHLGDIIFWTLAGARIERPALEQIWSASGLNAELLPEPPTIERSFKTAVKESQAGHPDLLLRLAREDEHQIAFGVVKEHRQGDGTLTYTQEATAILERAAGRVTADAAHHEVVAAIQSRFELLKSTHTPDDVRRAVVRALHSFAAVTLRDGGGIYWVPQTVAEKVRRLQVAVEQIGSSRMYLVPVHRTTEAERALGQVATESIEAELASLKAEIEVFMATPPERASTLIRRFDVFEELRSRANLYRSILSAEVQDLDAQLDQLSGAVELLLAQKAQQQKAA
jgi:hypothetical protein